MKKVVLMCILLVSLAACKQTEASEEPINVANDSITQETPEPVAALPECELPIVIDLERIANEPDRETWKNDNPVCSLASPPDDAPLDKCSANKVYADLEKIIGVGDPDTYAKRAAWLKKNASLICFEETYCYIAKSHEITQAADISDIEKIGTAHRTSLKLSEIITRINAEGGNFGTDLYQNYLVCSYSGGKLLLTVEEEYAHPYISYSIPFLKSIIACHKITGDPTFEFIDYYKINPSTVVIKIHDGSQFHYYDYSQQPQSQMNAGNQKRMAKPKK